VSWFANYRICPALLAPRQQYGVGIVLEDIQAQQDLTQARSDYFTALAEYNKAQYALIEGVPSYKM
jgi:hypothetical protein